MFCGHFLCKRFIKENTADGRFIRLNIYNQGLKKEWLYIYMWLRGNEGLEG